MRSDMRDEDIALLNEIYNKYKNIIYYWIRRKACNPSHFDDIFQEVMIRIYKSIKNYDIKHGALKNYIRAITYNTVADYYRKNDISNIIVNTEIVIEAPGYDHTKELIDLQIDLTPFEYDLFVSYYVMGMTKRAIAKDFNLKYGTCRNRLKDLEVKLNSLYNKDK